MASNYLKLNDDKTEVLVIGSCHDIKSKVKPFKIKIGDHEIEPTHEARNIGVVFDANLSMAPHVSKMSKSLWYHLYNISKIRQFLDRKSVESLVHALLTSKMDFCNTLLFNIPNLHLKPLERIQKAAARMILQQSKYDDAFPLMKQLHWLPIRQRIIYKILILSFKALHNQAPVYISDLISPYNPTRALRSADKSYLTPFTTKKTTYGDRSFAYAAPFLWNDKDFPQDIKEATSLLRFKSLVKTFLFRQAYD